MVDVAMRETALNGDYESATEVQSMRASRHDWPSQPRFGGLLLV